MTSTYRIPEENMEKFEKKINAIIKKANKLGNSKIIGRKPEKKWLNQKTKEHIIKSL